MASYRPPISRDQYHDLEAYYFKLVMFTDSWEYKQLGTVNQHKINYEIGYIKMALDIMSQLFSVKGGTERRVVAWQSESDQPFERIFHFSCIKVASKSLSCNASKISAVCKGKRKSTGGEWILNKETGKKEHKNSWVFMYEDEYEQKDIHGLKK